MDEAASVLTGFPLPSSFSTDEFYDDAVHTHMKKIEQLLSRKKDVITGDNGIQLLKLLDPAVNSISYLLVLDTLQDYDGFDVQQRAQALIDFFLSFDARQIRYVGSLFSQWLKLVASERFPLPHDIKVGLVANAILRIDPTGSMLTSHHLDLVYLAHNTDTAEHAFAVLDKQIVFFPGMSQDQSGSYSNSSALPQKPLCDMSLPPTDYINQETGLTMNLDVERVLEYDFFSGLLYCSREQWQKARAAFERVITHPTRDGGVSKIMTDAYKKWLLVSLLVNGRTPEVPANVGLNAKKAYETVGKPYAAIASHFDAMAAVALKKEVEDHAEPWRTDLNLGLVRQVLAAHQKWQIMDLRKVYSKVSLSDIRLTTFSAETGAILPSDDEVDGLIQGMIASGMLKGVIERPQGKPAYLKYLSEAEELSETEYKNEIASAMLRMKELEDIYRTTNARLSTNPYWLKHLIREQKREKENSGQGTFPQGFDAEVEDEDLMSGVMPGHI